jgi:hypothetical protein
MVGLLLESRDVDSLARGYFDGAYSYFAADGFTYAATQHNWRSLETACRQRNLVPNEIHIEVPESVILFCLLCNVLFFELPACDSLSLSPSHCFLILIVIISISSTS